MYVCCMYVCCMFIFSVCLCLLNVCVLNVCLLFVYCIFVFVVFVCAACMYVCTLSFVESVFKYLNPWKYFFISTILWNKIYKVTVLYFISFSKFFNSQFVPRNIQEGNSRGETGGKRNSRRRGGKTGVKYKGWLFLLKKRWRKKGSGEGGGGRWVGVSEIEGKRAGRCVGDLTWNCGFKFPLFEQVTTVGLNLYNLSNTERENCPIVQTITLKSVKKLSSKLCVNIFVKLLNVKTCKSASVLYLSSHSLSFWWTSWRCFWRFCSSLTIRASSSSNSPDPSNLSRSNQPRHRTQTPLRIKELRIWTWNKSWVILESKGRREKSKKYGSKRFL